MEYYLYEVVTKKLGDERYLQKTDYTQYTLPVATVNKLGGIKVGDGLAITNAGVLSATVQAWDSLTGKPFASVSTTDFVVSNGLLNINSSTWAKKTDLSTYYTKSEINDLFSSLKKATITVVSSLPSTGEEGIIYFVGDEAPYEQYVYESGIGWISLGSTEIDLTPYVQGSDLTADTIILGNGSRKIKTSSKKITTTLGNDDATLPTSKAVKTAVDNSVSTAKTELNTTITNLNSTLTASINKKQDTLTTAQLNAVNSGITANKVSTYDSYASTLANKQDKLTGIGPVIIDNNKVSLKVHNYENNTNANYGYNQNVLSLESNGYITNTAVIENEQIGEYIITIYTDTNTINLSLQFIQYFSDYLKYNWINFHNIPQFILLHSIGDISSIIIQENENSSDCLKLSHSLLLRCNLLHSIGWEVGWEAGWEAEISLFSNGVYQQYKISLYVLYQSDADIQVDCNIVNKSLSI